MEKITIWTNNFDRIRVEVEEALKSGKAVRVGASCVGNTRAHMIQMDTKRFMGEIGASIYGPDPIGCGFDFYYLKKEESKKRGRPKKIRL